jgi:hypothetical protein
MRPGNPAKSWLHCSESTSPRPGTASTASSLSLASLGKEMKSSEICFCQCPGSGSEFFFSLCISDHVKTRPRKWAFYNFSLVKFPN